MGIPGRKTDGSDGRHRCPWPAEKLASTPWLFLPFDQAVVSPFGRRGRSPMTLAELEVADVVVSYAKAATEPPAALCWLWPADGRMAAIQAPSPSWVACWAGGKHIVPLWL